MIEAKKTFGCETSTHGSVCFLPSVPSTSKIIAFNTITHPAIEVEKESTWVAAAKKKRGEK
jgi:hypothetical protein